MTRPADPPTEHYPWCDRFWCCAGVRHHSDPIRIDTLDAEYRLSLIQMIYKDPDGEEDNIDPEPRVFVYAVHKTLREEGPARCCYVRTEVDDAEEGEFMVTLPSKISLADARRLADALEELLRVAQQT